MKTSLYLVSALNAAFAVSTLSRLCLVFAVVTGLAALVCESVGMVKLLHKLSR